MNLSPELVIAISGFVTALFVGWGQHRASQLAARKDEVQLLRDEVVRLQARVSVLEDKNDKLNEENDALREENRLLREEVLILREMLRKNSIAIPPSRIFPIQGDKS